MLQKSKLKVGIWVDKPLKQELMLGNGQLTVEEARDAGQLYGATALEYNDPDVLLTIF